jgi:carboxymethylenebutenolidase
MSVHEAFGLNDHIRDIARRFAALGYTAVAPDLYSREGAPADGDMDAVLATMRAMLDERIVGDLVGAAALLREQPNAGVRVGCVGFCSGGRQTLLAACSSTAIDAAVDCWG